MHEVDPSSHNPAQKVKLVFDVMTQEPVGDEKNASEPKTMDLQPNSPATIPEPPQLPGELIPPSLSTPLGESGAKSRWHFSAPRLNIATIATVIAVIVLAIGGYFSYRYFSDSEPVVPPEQTIARPGESAEAKMPDDWLTKYFGSIDCPESVCAPQADPDAEGLLNSDELKYTTDPNNPDTDYDGIADSDELQVYNSDPLVADTDGDGFEDGLEARNGYSPSLGGSEKISVVENQVIADNIERYGLRDLTKTFLNLKVYKAVFDGSNTTTPAFILSVPKDWTAESAPEAITLKSPDKKSLVYLGRFAPAPASEADFQAILASMVNAASADRKKIGVSQQKIGQLSLNVDEYQVLSQAGEMEGTHVLRALFLKDARVYQVYFSTPESQWTKSQILARGIINNIR